MSVPPIRMQLIGERRQIEAVFPGITASHWPETFDVAGAKFSVVGWSSQRRNGGVQMPEFGITEITPEYLTVELIQHREEDKVS